MRQSPSLITLEIREPVLTLSDLACTSDTVEYLVGLPKEYSLNQRAT